MTTNPKTTDTLKINGMACQNCVGRVEKGISSLAGVYTVTVDLAAKTATVTYDPAQIGIPQIAATISSLGHGYEVFQD